MRRKDREISDARIIADVVEECQAIRLGLRDKDKVYIVPLHFGYMSEDGKYTFYCHSAKEGRKIDLIKSDEYVFFEMDCGQILTVGNNACSFSSQFKSIMGEGRVTLVEDIDEKKLAFGKIMLHYTQKEDWDIPVPALNSVEIIKIEVDSMSCKIHE